MGKLLKCEECGGDNLILYASIEHNPDIDYYVYCDDCEHREIQKERASDTNFIKQANFIHPKYFGLPNSKVFYHAYLKTNKWNRIRKKVLARADYTCEGCGEKDLKLQVHHKTYDHVFNEFMFDLLALCEYCHKRVHAFEDKK